ncbi:hypothetical protein JCM1840_000241, partial [Sporobolomyces johnsonii]
MDAPAPQADAAPQAPAPAPADGPHLRFAKALRLHGSWQANSTLLFEAGKLLRAPYAARDHSALLGRIAAISAAARHSPRLDALFMEYWKAQLRLLPRHHATGFTAAVPLPDGVHPLLAAIVRDDEDDGATQTDRQSYQRSSPERDPTPGGFQLGDVVFPPAGGARGGTGGAPDGARPPDQAQRAGPPQQPQRPVAADFLGQVAAGIQAGAAGPPPPGGGGLGLDFGADPATRARGYEFGVLNALAGREQPITTVELPEDVLQYRDRVHHRRLDFFRKETKPHLATALRAVASHLGMAYSDVQSIAMGEYVSLAQVRDSHTGATIDLPSELAEVFEAKQLTKRATPAPLHVLQWEATFDKWSEVVDLVNSGGAGEAMRKRRYKVYKAYVQQLICRADTDTVQVRRLLAYDELVRAEVCKPVDEAEIRHFGEASTHDLLYLTTVISPSSSAPSSSSVQPARPPRTAPPSPPGAAPLPIYNRHSPYCWRYNTNAPHTGCQHLHSCYSASGRPLRAEEMDEEEWLPGGMIRGGDAGPAANDPSPPPIDEDAPINALSGIGDAPRLLRAFHWPPPADAPPVAPAVEASLTFRPLPRPPPSTLEDPVLSSLLVSRPSLFSSYSPLHADAFAAALADHPNRAFVDSLLVSLREGFWPVHDGSPPRPPPPARSSRLYSTDRDDQRVLVENAVASVAAGLISPAMDDLPAGCEVSPQFVVRKEGSAPRVVDDHSASGLNDGIGDSPAWYDRVDSLIRVLRSFGILDNTLPEPAVLYKLDVAAAFKLLLMHPRWQARQAILVPYRDRDGRVRPRDHLQWRAAFGSRASPCLWTSLMAAVEWVVRQRAADVVPFPLFYMDDAFGVDLSGETALVEHDGEARRLPRAQAESLAVWDELGLAWKWKKAQSGRRLTITGIVIDLDTATVEIEDQVVDAFAAAAAHFLDSRREPDRQRPLREWRQIVGWANWLITVRPWARPLLQPLFAKLGRSPSPYALVFLNKEVGVSLRALVSELQSGDPLDLKDPMLTHWDAAAADVTVFTDACEQSVGGDGAGLGFWYEYGGRRSFFASRPRRRFPVQFAEGLAAYSAIEHVVGELEGVRRLLIKTDSAPVVYAFDAGGSHQPQLASLVADAYRFLRARSVDIRVVHVSGVSNVTADRLSREPSAPRGSREGAHQMSGKEGARTVSFAPRVKSGPSRPKDPFPSPLTLLRRRLLLWRAAVAPSTATAYERAFKKWQSFAIAYGHRLFPSPHSLSLFVAFRSPSVLPQTLAGELSGVAFYFKSIDTPRWIEARSSPEVTRAMLGNAKLNPHTPKKALPLPLDALVAGIAKALATGATYDDLLWAAQLVVAFLSCARAQEVSEYDNPLFRDHNKHTLRLSARLTPFGFAAHLPYHKADA